MIVTQNNETAASDAGNVILAAESRGHSYSPTEHVNMNQGEKQHGIFTENPGENPNNITLAKAAWVYTQRNGFRQPLDIFPLIPRRKEPIQKGGFYNATHDPEIVKRFWSAYPTANIGCRPNGFVIVDVDCHSDDANGAETLRGLEREHGELPMTWTGLTPTGGAHYYFATDDTRLTLGESIAPGIDFRGSLSHALLPPSVHPNGKVYMWDAGRSPADTPMAPLPEWLHALLLAAVSNAKSKPKVETIPDGIPVSQRNSVLFRVACFFRAKGLTVAEMLPSIMAINKSRCETPLGQREVENICKSAGRYERGDLPGGSLKPDDYSDAGNAAVFVKRYGDDLIYTKELGWLHWNGLIWESSGSAALGLAWDLSDDMLAEARKADLEARQKLAAMENAKQAGDPVSQADYETVKRKAQAAESYLKHAKTTRRSGRLQAIPTLAVPRLTKPITVFDNLWDEINTPGGIVDLTTGGMREHDKSSHFTQMTRFAPGDQGWNKWIDFISFVSGGDIELMKYHKRKIGSAAFGRLFTEGIDFEFGSGANGKSTMFNVLFYVFGTYSGNFSANLIVEDTRVSEFKHELAALRGKRFALAGELEEGKRLTVSFLKRLTSTDSVVVEHKFKDPFELKPTHTTFMHTNFLPEISSAEHALWRRVHVVPFDNTIPTAEMDPEFESKLINECGPAIMKWIVQGAVEFAENGFKLDYPDAVRIATSRFGRETDSNIAQFVQDGCDTGDGLRSGAREIYNAYVEWAEKGAKSAENKDEAAFFKAESERVFSQFLFAAGFDQIKPKNKRTWLGICPKK